MTPSESSGLALAGFPVHPGLRSNAAAVRVEHDAKRFRQLLRSERPALVVVCSPPATSIDIYAVARHRRRRSDMRVVLIDRRESTHERLDALRAGFDDAFAETIGAIELVGRLQILADRAHRAQRGRAVQISPRLALQNDANELRVDGQAVHLRPREHALLQVLAHNPGRTFTREQLLDAVGVRASTHHVRTVDVHIRWLREKLDHHGGLGAQLVTVRGVGYRLELSPQAAHSQR